MNPFCQTHANMLYSEHFCSDAGLLLVSWTHSPKESPRRNAALPDLFLTLSNL